MTNDESPTETRKHLRRVWSLMKHRCSLGASAGQRRYYCDRISVCSEWLDSFEPFYRWAVEHGAEPKGDDDLRKAKLSDWALERVGMLVDAPDDQTRPIAITCSETMAEFRAQVGDRISGRALEIASPVPVLGENRRSVLQEGA